MLGDFVLDKKSLSKLSTCGLSQESFKAQLKDEDIDFMLELWRAQGLDIVKYNSLYYYATKFLTLENTPFCIVDVETNGSKTEKHQIIEIGAVKILNGKVLATFESLVHCEEINSHITQITGISVEDTKDAPPLKSVMQDFKLFLGDCVFVAHDIKFDFKFVSSMMEKTGLSPLLNRHLCTINLSERTIESYRYGLSYLNELLDLYKEATHHRALSDAITTTRLFLKTLTLTGENVKTAEDLISFSKNERRLKRPKFDPLLTCKEEE